MNTKNMNRLSLRSKHLTGSPSVEGKVSNPPGLLVFQYLERDSPYGREPLADKVSQLSTWRFYIALMGIFNHYNMCNNLYITDLSSCIKVSRTEDIQKLRPVVFKLGFRGVVGNLPVVFVIYQ